jgi:hypothetical protein
MQALRYWAPSPQPSPPEGAREQAPSPQPSRRVDKDARELGAGQGRTRGGLRHLGAPVLPASHARRDHGPRHVRSARAGMDSLAPCPVGPTDLRHGERAGVRGHSNAAFSLARTSKVESEP